MEIETPQNLKTRLPFSNGLTKEEIIAFEDAFKNCKERPVFYVPSTTESYDELRQVFNRRFDFMPSLIIQPRTTENVAIAIAYATEQNIPITVKSGGHDHEGECVATGKVLIDFGKMNETNASLPDFKKGKKSMKQISIQPGSRFRSIKEVLDDKGLGIPHGTCQSVAIAGYTMGGGWGPWTRKYGMGCERLKGATIVLGDGTIKYLGTSAFYNKDKANKENTEGYDSKLLWAIRGGGGLSYGIVTEFFFEPFELPNIAFSFHISNDMLPVFDKIKAHIVIKAWEEIIKPERNPNLIGTNLKVLAKPVKSELDISEEAILEWTLNGHFGGNRTELKEMMLSWGKYVVEMIEKDPVFSKREKQKMINDVEEGLKKKFDEAVNSTYIQSYVKGVTNGGYPFTFENWDRYSVTAKEHGLTLETDCPAPHKITSRMPTENWEDEDMSRKQLVCSLQSTLLYDLKESNISSYITLGAINGDFYATKEAKELSALSCAFPYQTRPFTIQYQTWWDMPTENEEKLCTMDTHTTEKIVPTRFHVNRALDWMEECRDFKINETDGSFISFKDSSIPTKNYFVHNYEELMKIKLKYSEDSKNLFQSRKTII
ncbi:FAD-dependent oxidoreductase [Tenacibaculum amylolyticum]|uniref:FAD-dependent oxidoreductase n=1 Tax=Tenacibaculum amylolyticum TaxID=104269 RepID=UPI003893E49E